MSLFLAKRCLTLLATLLFTSLVIFLVLEVLPGDPALVRLGVDAPPEAVAALRERLGLDRPAAERYLAWLAALAGGRLGESYAYGQPVALLLAERLQVTLPLAALAMVMTLGTALALGLWAAARHNRPADLFVMGVSQLGLAIPNFWFAILLILLFAVGLGWLPAGGFPGWERGLWPGLRSLLLPAVALATAQIAVLARVTRSAVLEVLREDFVRTARAKGLTRGQVLRDHVLRNALIPVVTIAGLQLGALITGTIVVEQVFTLPGLGRLLFQAIANRDLELVRNLVVVFALATVLINFLVDLLYAAIDPRLEAADV